MDTRGMECEVCGRMWIAICPEHAKAIKCPDCGTMAPIPVPKKEEEGQKR